MNFEFMFLISDLVYKAERLYSWWYFISPLIS